jgi:hypothetical protein
MSTDKDTLRWDVLAALGPVAYSAEFVPQSKSRNASGKRRALNWRVTLARPGGRAFSTEYSQGVGHIPDHRPPFSTLDVEAYELEVCETGRYAPGGLYVRTERGTNGPKRTQRAPLPPPNLLDVLHSLLVDASVLDAASFEDWAAEFDYDPDSRAAERTYNECLTTALALRALLGDATMTRLRELLQDY